jgi:thiamine-phosphate pyrophosphorylase
MIPKLHYISQGKTSKEHIENIQKACASGAELVQLYLDFSSEKKRLNCAQEARDITSHFQTRLIIVDQYKIAKAVKADGVHFTTINSFPTNVKADLYPWQIIAGTANTIQDCEKLLDKQVSYMYLGPFRESSNGTTLPILGLNGYTAITKLLKTGTPIIGFGGITTQDVTAIVQTGLSGVAVSDEITHDFNTIRTYNKLLNASSTAEQRHTFTS